MNYRVVDIPGYPGYKITDDGKIWSKKHKKFLRPSSNPSRGAYIHLFDPQGQRRGHSIGRLVLLSFVGPPGPDQVCCHGPRGRFVHTLDNLSWGSRSKNSGEDRHRDGTMPCLQGESHGNAKLTADDVKAIRKDSRTLKAIAVDYQVSFGLIWQIKRRKAWTHIQ